MKLSLHAENTFSLGFVDDLYGLLRAINESFPEDATLYIEGTSLAPDLQAFLETHETGARTAFVRETISPLSRQYHLPLSGSNLVELRAIAERHAEPEICDHLAVYRNGEILLTAPDAGDGEVFVVRSLPESVVLRLKESLGDALRTVPL